MPIVSKFLLEFAATLVTLGGLYDLLAPKLPANLSAMCQGNPKATKLARELLRALGGALVAIGLTVGAMAAGLRFQDQRSTLILILLLVLPAEGINSLCMYRVGSPYLFPMAFALLTVVGAILAWPGLMH
jgi:hypothetical protein